MRMHWGWPLGSRGRSSLLVVIGSRLVRADFDGLSEPEIRGLWESAAPAGAGMAELVEAAWMLGPRERRRVHALVEPVATLGLAIPAGKMAGLQGTGLGRALAFEAEAISGIGPFDAAQGWVGSGTRDGLNWYWVSQLPRAEVERLVGLISPKGATVEGILHPGGLPRRLGPGSGGWQRIELWDEHVVCVDGLAPQAARVRIVEAPASRSGWEAVGSDAFQPFPGERGILAATSALARQGPGVAQVLEDEEVLREWLRGWARELASDGARVPVIRPDHAAAFGAGRRKARPIAVAAAVALACGAHATWTKGQQSGFRRELEEAGRPAAELSMHRRKASELEVQLNEARRELKGLEELRAYWKDTLDREHRRHATLLRVLAETMPEGVMLAGLTEGSGEMRVSGVSLSPAATGLGTRMGAAMESFGWRAEPPTRRALGLLPGGGPWQVEWTLKAVAPPPGGPMAGLTNLATGLSREAARTSVLAVGLPGRDEGGGR